MAIVASKNTKFWGYNNGDFVDAVDDTWDAMSDDWDSDCDGVTYSTNDAYDEALLRIYQDVERRTLGSFLGSRFHERLQANGVKMTAGASNTWESKVFSPLFEHRDDASDASKFQYKLVNGELRKYLMVGDIFGYEKFKQEWFDQFFQAVVPYLVASEYPVHDSRRIYKKNDSAGQPWRLLATRIDGVEKLDGDKYRIVEYKTSGGSKWLSAPNKAKKAIEDAIVQGVINADLFEQNTGLTVTQIKILVIERKRRCVYDFTLSLIHI